MSEASRRGKAARKREKGHLARIVEKGRPEEKTAPFPIVALGASAGGLEALTQFTGHLTPDMGLAYVVVQHLDPKHKSLLVELLGRNTPVPIQEVRGRTKVEKDHIYVIPPNRHMFIEDGHLRLSPRSKFAGKEMPIDYLFRTLSLDRPGSCIGIVLSGTGSDGALGVEEIKSTGGINFAQTEESAKYDGMPRAAISTGCIDYVLPPDRMAHELRRIALHPFIKGKQENDLSQEGLLKKIFQLLKNRTSVDFKHYKQNTVKRRIFRRMALLRIEVLNDYVRLLSDNLAELDLLYQDLLIKVTSFFREPASFKMLQEQVFPSIMRGRDRHEPIRLWVPGCSTGEEVYSLAIALLEFLGDQAGSAPIQIFGTDVSDRALEKARSGIYIENIALDVSSERLRRWFFRIEQGYQISKTIREMCVFAKQNITTDPPFSKIDLISCRNLLIYLDHVFQARIMPIFHYALKPTGFLMLGNSESVGGFLNLFSPVDGKAKIYTKKAGQRPEGISFNRISQERLSLEHGSATEAHHVPDIFQEADRFIVSRFAPNGVIVDEDLKIVQFRGSTGEYLEPSPGRATFHLLKMARGNLALELRTLVQRARTTNRPVRKDDVPFQIGNGVSREIAIEVAPIQIDPTMQGHYLILFEEPSRAAAASAEPPPEAAPTAAPGEKDDRELLQVRRELASTKSQLQSTIEDTEATNEELKSANEEIMSSNEELQSTNEELETAKEELQSANEELRTVNEEVQTRNAELSQLNGDLNNFLGSVNIPFIMLGTDLKIRRFTPMAQRVFNIISTDVGRFFGEIKPKIDAPHLERRVAQVIDSMTIHESEVRDTDGHYYQMSIRPYRTPDNKIEGAVLVFVDIDAMRRSLFQVEAAKLYAESIVEAVFDPLLVLDRHFTIQRANSAYYNFFQATPATTENRSLFALDKSQWDTREIRQLLRSSLKPRKKTAPIEVIERFSRVGKKILLIHARPIPGTDPGSPLVLVTLNDITERRKAEEERAVLTRELSRERALFEATLRQVRTGVAIFEAPTGRLLLANDYLPSVLHARPPASTTLNWFRKLPARRSSGEPLKMEDWPMHRSLNKGETVEEEIVLTRSRDRFTVVQISSSAVFDANKKMTAVVALFHDITDRVQVQNQIVEASSREQRRIAQDLHDGVGQQLAAVGYRIKALKSQLDKGRSPQARDTGEIGALVATALAQTRDLAKFLLPVALEERGLMHSLRELTRTTSHIYRVDCVFECDRPVLISDADVALSVFRIAQEAIHNAIKHGKPRRIVVALRRSGHSANFTITNDGHDFQPPRSDRKKGMGLEIMRYRANLIHGDLSIEPRRPRGTRVRCLFKPDASYDH